MHPPMLNVSPDSLDYPPLPASASKMSLDSLLSEPPMYEAAPSSYPAPRNYPAPSHAPVQRQSVISCGQHPAPAPATPPSLRIQRRKYEEKYAAGGRGGHSHAPGHRAEVEGVCVRLMCHYNHCLAAIPPRPAPAPHTAPGAADSLVAATRQLTEAVARTRLFLSGLDTFTCLAPADRATLYRHNVCSIQILKASLSTLKNICKIFIHQASSNV